MTHVAVRRALATLVALVALAVYGARGSVFHLREASVVGDSWVLEARDVRLGLAKSGTMSLLYGEFGNLEEHLASNQEVRSAQVELSWPDSIVIDVRAREPYARSSDGGLVDSNGEWYDSGAGEGLPIFSMPRAQMPVAVGFHADASETLARRGLGITQMHHSWDGWRIFLSNGWVLLLGEHKHRERLERFVRAYPDLGRSLESGGNIRLDMRYPNGMAVAGWMEGDENG